MVKLSEGQKVKVYGRHRSPTSVEEAEIVKVGRTLVTIAWGERDYQRAQFRMDTGKDNGYGNSWFKTLERAAADDALAAAWEYLRTHGVSRDYDCDLAPPIVIALAEFLQEKLAETDGKGAEQ